MNKNLTNCKLVFQQGIHNGSMNMLMYVNDELIADYKNTTQETFELSVDVVLPCRFKFILSNKNSNTDTLVDNQGQILADKFIVLKQFFLARVEIPTHKLQATCEYTTDQGIFYDTYWGFNGQAVVDFPYGSAVEWHLRSQIK
jgi:hypothetical protein